MNPASIVHDVSLFMPLQTLKSFRRVERLQLLNFPLLIFKTRPWQNVQPTLCLLAGHFSYNILLSYSFHFLTSVIHHVTALMSFQLLKSSCRPIRPFQLFNDFPSGGGSSWWAEIWSFFKDNIFQCISFQSFHFGSKVSFGVVDLVIAKVFPPKVINHKLFCRFETIPPKHLQVFLLVRWQIRVLSLCGTFWYRHRKIWSRLLDAFKLSLKLASDFHRFLAFFSKPPKHVFFIHLIEAGTWSSFRTIDWFFGWAFSPI